MGEAIQKVLRRLALGVGRLLGAILFNVKVEGKAHLPPAREPLIVISNHFSWYDAPILTLYLPFQPTFLVATESRRMWYVRAFMWLFNGIPVWRGKVDRDAFRRANKVLQADGVIGIFPEGGIDPRMQRRVAHGDNIVGVRAQKSRISGQLTHPRPGPALLAVQSRARILPVALFGVEKIGRNLRRLRRTSITMRIGPAFGPLALEQEKAGPERRHALDQLSERMMMHIALLFPPEKRGPYRDQPLEKLLDEQWTAPLEEPSEEPAV